MRNFRIRLISLLTSVVILLSSAPINIVGNAVWVEGNVVIRIHYLVEGGGKVFNDYSVSLLVGEDYYAEVPSPTFSGYEPVMLENGEYVSAKTVTLDYKNLLEDKDITVTYRPAKTPYTVRYFLQNVNNDGYTEDASMTLYGEALTGEYPRENIEKQIDGFYPLFHEPDKVAADGQTEFLIYYNRRNIGYTFDCNRGFGTDSVYARFGTNLVVPNPTRPGYVFSGWDRRVNGEYDGTVDDLPASLQASDEVYKAVWTAANTTVRVAYWLEDPDNPGKYDYLAERDAVERVSGTRIQIERIESQGLHIPPDDVDISHYEYDREATADSILHTPAVKGDGSTVVSVYYKRKEYTLKFFYARSKEVDGETKYYVVGGSSYGFSLLQSANDKDLLNNIEATYPNTWGEVQNLPEINDPSNIYTYGPDVYDEHVDSSGVSYKYYYLSFKARYGQNIEDEWPFGSTENPVMQHTKIVGTHIQWHGEWAIFSGWNPEYYVRYCRDEAATSNPNYTIKGDYIRLDESLLYDVKRFPNVGDSSEILFIAFWENGANISWSIPELYIYNLYVEALDGAVEQPGQTFVKRDYDGDGTTENYFLYKSYRTCDDSYVEKQTATPLLGFTYRFRESRPCDFNDTYYSEGYSIDFFYTRNSYKLRRTRYDGSVYAEDMVQRGESIKSYLDPPSYPDTLEPDAYEFGGWYRSPIRIEHVNEETVMPSADMTIYAKWNYVDRNVTFSKTLEDMENGNYLKDGIVLEHNSQIPTADIPNVQWEGHSFRGWFYIDDKGKICAFDPHSMPVTQDLNLFGRWQSPMISKYKVHYVSSDGKKIADDTEGRTFVSNTKTFEAKADNDLYQDYREGYFPRVNSKSIVIKPDENDNVLTLEYVNKGSVNYTVRYVDSTTGNEIAAAEVKNTTHAVVTEHLKVIDGYVADSFYKRLVLTADESKNVLTFYYVRNEGTQKLNYAVRHFTQDLDGVNFSEYSSQDFIANEGDQITVDPLSITGFSLSRAEIKTSDDVTRDITVDDSGISMTLSQPVVINIYYTRNDSTCNIHFVEYGTSGDNLNVLKAPVTYKGKYGETLTYEPDKTITKDSILYTLVGSATRNITYRDGVTDVYIYYQSKTILINYQPICLYPNMTGGKVSHMSEMVTSGANVVGCDPLPNEGFKFAGWFEDRGCTVAVDPTWVDEKGKIIPKTADSATYYALFEPNAKAAITITKSGVEESDQGQSFLFEIKEKDGTVDLIVSITGNGSVTVNDLPLGDYTVTEITDWSWRYDLKGDNGKAVKLTADGAAAAFENKRNSKKWLGGEAQKDNHFDKITV